MRFECIPAVRRTARAGATPGVGLQPRGARFRPRWLRPVSFTLVGSGSDVREVSQFSTRSGVLRASRGEASGPHDPKGHRSNNPFISSILSCSGRALRGWAKGPARRPGDPKGSQKQQSIHCPRLPCSACRPFVLGAPPRAANASLRPRTAILWNRAISSLPIAARRQRGVQRAPTSCSPPRGVAANCAAL